MLQKLCCALLLVTILFPNAELWAKKSDRASQRGTRSSGAKTTSDKAASGSRRHSSASKTKGKSKGKKVAAKKRVSPQKLRRMNRAFVASSQLRPMAKQLFEQRTAPAYRGIEAYSRQHAGTDAGALGYMALGYAHILDRDYAAALPPLAKAQARAGELSDYVRYFEALAYAGQNQSARVVEVLRDFEERYPDSVLRREAGDVYVNALLTTGQSREAINYLEAHRTPARASVELALGKAYLHAGETEKGMEVLRHLYFTMPASADAGDALTQMRAQGSTVTGSYAEHEQRAKLLEKANRWIDAAAEYRSLLTVATPEQHDALEVSLGVALRRSGDVQGARDLLQSVVATGDAEAMRLYNLGELSRASDETAFVDNLNRLRQVGPTSPALQSALLSAANFYLLRKDYDKAIDYFRELQQRFPNANRASYAHWKAAWLSYRQGRTGEAQKAFEEQIAWYPTGNEVPAALYWRARIAENSGDIELARTYYKTLVDRFRNYYYGCIGRERLMALPAPQPGVTPLQDPILAKIPPAAAPGDGALSVEAPDDDIRLEKSKLLENAGLTDFAIRELQAANGGTGANWATLQIARIYQEQGNYHRALQFLKRSVPSYYSLDISALARRYWEVLFPKPYWNDLQRYAVQNGLDPYLVASLIRQESEFNPGAVSPANAFGLMQLLPSNGKTEAKQIGIRRFSTSSLLDPNLNLQVGTRFFKKMVDQYSGQVEYALAAYNAGTNRVEDWQAVGHYRDIPEFVESIPFTETREYVQAIIRNAQVYRALYPPASQSVTAGGGRLNGATAVRGTAQSQ